MRICILGTKTADTLSVTDIFTMAFLQDHNNPCYTINVVRKIDSSYLVIYIDSCILKTAIN